MRFSRLLLASTALAATVVSAPAFAQGAGATPTTAADQASSVNDATDTEAADETTIVVTGSRIRRAGFDTLEPATVVSSEYLDARGLTNVADALNEIPGFGVGVTPEGGQSSFGVGQNFVNRFGLGSARTLTLVNGRRFVSSNAPSIFGNAPGLQVDLNVIPSELIDRIENIAIGGAPTYGSDAIAGTVNIILKRDFEGIHTSGTFGITELGDNERYNGTILVGQNFGGDRGNITAAFTYDRNEGVLALERSRFRRGLAFGTNPTAGTAAANAPAGRTPFNDGRVFGTPFNTGNADGIANSVLIRNARIFSLTEGGLLYPLTGAFNGADGLPRGFGATGTNRLQFDPSGNLVAFNPGNPFGAQNASGGDGFDLNSSSQLTSDLERYTGNVIARYEISDAIGLFFEGTYFRANSTELVDQPIYNATLFGGASASLTFSAADPRLTTQARTALAAAGVTDFRLSRASTDLVVNNASSESEIYRGVAGLEGEFEFLGGEWFYEASANLGRSEGVFFQDVLNQQNFVNAINVTTNAAGQIVCNPTPVRNVAPGTVTPRADAACVPLNVFGQGVASPEALAYVTDATRTEAVLEQEVYNINFGGDLFELWAGPVGFAAGYEHRVERGSFSPDPFALAGLGRAVPIGANSGSFNTDEVFAEVLIPLINEDTGISFIQSADLEGKVRYVDNTVNGGFTAYTVGGRVRPIDDIEFRGNYTRSLRAPAITELFTPISPLFNFFPDPCDRILIGSGPNVPVRQANCAAFFADYGINGATFDSTARVASIPQLSGGDPNLDNEVANSYTFGVVLRPTFVPRFRLAVDWNRVRITGNIASLLPADIASGCYDNPDFDTSDVDNANSFCSRFDRIRGGPNNGQIVNDAANPGVRSGFVNGAFIEFKGLTAEADYNFPVGEGTIDVGATYFYLHRLVSSNNGVTPNPDQGEFGNPRHEGQFNLGYTLDALGVDLQARYTGRVEYNNLNTVETQDILDVEDQLLFNLALSYKLKEETFVRFTVTNLLDKAPPFPTGGLGTYDTLGRRFALSFDYRF